MSKDSAEKADMIKTEMEKEGFKELKQVERQNLEPQKINNEIIFMDINDELTKKPLLQDI